MIDVGWSRNLHLRWPKLLVHHNKIIVIERTCHLVCIEPQTGKKLWDCQVDGAYGWLTALDNKIFYLGQAGVSVVDFKSGKLINILKMNNAHLGYIIPHEKFLITGSWRGYTDLTCYNLDANLSVNWKKNTKSEKSVSFSIPILFNNNLIFSDNSRHTISKIDITDGRVYWTIKLPENIVPLDLDYTFLIDNEKITVYSKDGKIYTLDEENLTWNKIVTHSTKITTVKPKILQSQYLFQDATKDICSYDKITGKHNWSVKCYHIQYRLPAIEIDEHNTLLCLSMQRKMIIDKTGKVQFELPPEKRYSSDLFRIENNIFYLSKSELKQLKIK